MQSCDQCCHSCVQVVEVAEVVEGSLRGVGVASAHEGAVDVASEEVVEEVCVL